MSVMVVSEKSLRLITVFLISTFEKDPIVNRSDIFRVWNDQEKYPVLCNLVNDNKESYQDITKLLSIFNCKAYAERYPDQEIDVTEDAATIPNFDNRWYYIYHKSSSIQIHKTLTCYLYQINDNENPIIQELKKLRTEYGEWILMHTDEWDKANWE